MKANQYSPLDREIVVLAAVWDLIGSMVHYGHFIKNDNLEEVMLRFSTPASGKLFLVILADFLSYPKDGTLGLSRKDKQGSLGWTYLNYIDGVADEPSFAGDTSQLRKSVGDFATWLDEDINVENVWFPSINYNGELKVSRLKYLKICGTASKHGFTRLGKVVKDLREIMADNNRPIDEGECYLLIPDFIKWFRDDVFIASSTTVAWHLNEIRWGIFKYLTHEYRRAYRPLEGLHSFHAYEYDVPPEISSPLIRSMYWDLLNEMRQPPYFPRFTVDRYLRKMY